MNIRRVTAAGALVATVACSRVREVFEPARFIAENNPPIVYVTQHSRAVVAIANPRVSGDSVFGTMPGQSHPVAVPFSEVHSVAAARVDGARTALLIAGATVASAFVAYVVLGGANGRDNWYCDYNDSVRGPNGEPLCGPALAR